MKVNLTLSHSIIAVPLLKEKMAGSYFKNKKYQFLYASSPLFVLMFILKNKKQIYIYTKD